MRYIFGIFAFAFILTYTVLFLRILCKRDLLSLKLITIETILQNLICIIVCSMFSSMLAQIILLYKELIFYGTVVIYFIANKKLSLRKDSVPLIIMIAICIPFFFIGSAPLYTKLVCFRQIMTPIILILYGRTYQLTENEIDDFVQLLIKIGILIVIFGFIEEFIVGDAFWLNLHIQKYMDMKGFSAWSWGGLPGNFYSADLHTIFGMMRRMVSIMADPLLIGHYLSLCVVILLFCPPKNLAVSYYLKLLLLTVGVVLTLSKGAILVIAISYTYKLWRKNKLLSIACAFVGFVASLYMIKNNTLWSLAQHSGGLASSLGNIIGKGLGSAGNYSNLYGGNSDIAESYLGALLGQMGIIGVAAFVYAIVYYLVKIKSVKNKLSLAIFAYILGILIEAIMSESSINFVGSGVAFIMLGVLSNETCTKYQKISKRNHILNWRTDVYEPLAKTDKIFY